MKQNYFEAKHISIYSCASSRGNSKAWKITYCLFNFHVKWLSKTTHCHLWKADLLNSSTLLICLITKQSHLTIGFCQNRDLFQNNRGGGMATKISQHRKMTVEKKILLPLLPGLEPETFWSQVHHSTTELSLLPLGIVEVIWQKCGTDLVPLGHNGQVALAGVVPAWHFLEKVGDLVLHGLAPLALLGSQDWFFLQQTPALHCNIH